MVWRTVIGTHSSGQIGIFISKPGIDAFANDPGNRNAWMFSSAIDKQANILQAGRCGLNETVTLPDMGFVPLVIWDYYSGGVASDDPQGTNTNGSPLSAYRLQHTSNTQFSIIKQASTISDPPAGSFFRYIAFTLSQDG